MCHFHFLHNAKDSRNEETKSSFSSRSDYRILWSAVSLELMPIAFWFLHGDSHIEEIKELGVPFGQVLSHMAVT